MQGGARNTGDQQVMPCSTLHQQDTIYIISYQDPKPAARQRTNLRVVSAEPDGSALAVGQQQAVTLGAPGHPYELVPWLQAHSKSP